MTSSGNENFQNIKAIEALRLGIVPCDSIEKWTQGRSEELKKILAWLNDLGQGTLIIEGQYGSGKTHMLRYLYSAALQSGYAVAMIDLDPSEATAAFPKRIYRRVISSLKAPVNGEMLDFRGLMRMIAHKTDENPVADHPYMGGLIDDLKKGEIDESTWNWIEGRHAIQGRYGSLWDFTTAANIYCHILSCLGWLMVKVLDLNGFLILFDEVETTKSMSYDYQILRGLNFFKGLSMVANDDPVLLEESVLKQASCIGSQTGLVYSGHSPTPYLYRIPSYLKAVFAITPTVLTSEFRAFRKTVPLLQLESLTVDDLYKMFVIVVKSYHEVYGTYIPPADYKQYFRIVVDRLNYGSMRLVIKSMVELMDFMRFYPNNNARDLLANV
ncbi:MAG: BREX system ATP-binding domain-containing protein [Pseudomonadota bacterium]